MMPKGPPKKRAKLGSQVPDLFTFSDVHDIKQALRSTRDQNVLSKGLLALRSKLSVKPSEVVAAHDERLSLAKLWMESTPAAEDLFDIWGTVNDMSIQALVMSLFSTLLSLFSCHFPDHVHGISIIKTVLSPQWLRRLNSCISGSHNELILSTLKLFHTISTFGSGRERKSVFEAFPWDNKNLPKLLYMRRRGKESERDEILDRPDIRTYYVLFILSMVDQDAASSVKAEFLEQRREVFMSIFKGLVQDHCTVVQKVLQVCWEGVWSDPKIKRTVKLGSFNELTTSHLLKLYDRATAESQGGEYVPADIVHHFLLAICTHPGQGICFRDRGWYPRDTDDGWVIDQEGIEDTRQKGNSAYAGKIHNKILANVLRVLKVNEDPRQQELALKIAAACPELVAGYWSAASLTLEPRLSSKWIANISFAGQVLSQPIPVSSFLLSGSDELYNPTPPPLSVIMGNLLPLVDTKTLFTKGLQAALAAIVQHCTALVLAKCLRKLTEVVHAFKMVEAALEEDEEEGQWSRRRREVEKEARRRVPEFQVIVAFSQQTLACTNTAKHVLLSESAQRLLGLYQECFPDAVAEARFEVGKLVLNLVEGSLASLSGHHEDGSKEPESQRKEGSTALQSVKHLHVLRLLSGSDQFTWAGKVASTHTYFYVLLKTFCNSRVRALRSTVKELLYHVLSESVLFQEDPNEVEAWLAALPFHLARRGQGTEAPDSASLTDEVESVLSFLDDCTQRCLKTPYRYMEAMANLIRSSKPENYRGEFASPLLMTVLEQALAKTSGQLMTASDALAILSFIRRLVVLLAAKQEHFGYHSLHAILDQLDGSLIVQQPFRNHPSICFGLRRELSIARACLRHFRGDCCQPAIQGPTEGTIAAFLNRIEQMPAPPSEDARMTGAFELVDWVRLVDVKPSASDISRLAAVIRRFYEPAVWVLINYLHPSDGHLWESDILKGFHDWPSSVDAFGWLYFHSNLPQLQDRHTRDILLTALYAQPATLACLQNAVRLIIHGVAVSLGRDDLTVALLSLLADMLARARGTLSGKDLQQLKGAIVQSDTVQELCVSHEFAVEVNEAIGKLISASFDSANAEDQILLSSICFHWAEMMITWLTSDRQDDLLELKNVRSWVSFMATQRLLDAIEIIQTSSRYTMVIDVIENILRTLQSRSQSSTSKVSVRVLMGLYASLPQSCLIEEMLSAALASQLPSGLDGEIMFVNGQALSALLSGAKPVQLNDLRSHPPNLIPCFLEKEFWTESTENVIVTLLYADPTSLQAYAKWLNSKAWIRLGVHAFASTLAAFLECTGLTSRDLSQVDDDILVGLLDQLFPGEWRHGRGRMRSLESVYRILELSGTRSTRLALILQERIQSIPIINLTFEALFLARKLFEVPSCVTLTTNIVDRALQWAVRYLSDDVDDSEDSIMAMENLRHLASHQKTLKPHLVEPLLTTLIQRHLSDTNMLDLATVLVAQTPLKPVVVNRLLQSVLQHQDFVSVCGKHASLFQRSRITRLLVALFWLHPANTCQASHIEPLFQVYGGTMSAPDRRLLSIMRLFEEEKCTSLSTFFSRWSPSADSIVLDALEVVQNFDPIYMLRTCLAFPLWRRFGEEKGARDGPADDSMYDPLVVIMLSAQMLVACPPMTPLGWVKMFRSNAVSLLIRCLSSKDPNIRATALCQIASLWESVQKSNMHETPQVVYVLRLLKNVIEPLQNVDGLPRRLPTFTTLILLHALRGIFYPSNFIYPRTARFLLQRPELDVSDVPMLFGMLYSNSDEWKKERGWMLRMLSDGMASTSDWNVLKRRHTWDLIASLFQSSKHDNTVRVGILEILANLTCNTQACISLVLKSSLLSWIEMQLVDSPTKESMAWLRILDNVLVTANTSKLTHAMGDRWDSTVCRCIASLLRNIGKEPTILYQCALVVLRLSLIPDIPHHALLGVICDATEGLRRAESRIELNRLPSTRDCLQAQVLPLPPHRSQGLHDVPAAVELLWTWGQIVETLWRAAMSLDNGMPVWGMLTRKLIVWRALVGEDGSQIGEWARKEAVRALHTC